MRWGPAPPSVHWKEPWAAVNAEAGGAKPGGGQGQVWGWEEAPKVRPENVRQGHVGWGGQRSIESEAGTILQETSDLKHHGKTGAWGQTQGQAELVRKSAPASRTDPWPTEGK